MEEIYNETLAMHICAVALHSNQCAKVLNVLSDGGAVTVQFDGKLAFMTGEQVRWLATDGEEGHA